MGCMGSVVKPHKWLLLKRPWEFVKELFRTYLVHHATILELTGSSYRTDKAKEKVNEAKPTLTETNPTLEENTSPFKVFQIEPVAG
jgi:hypothetical protein